MPIGRIVPKSALNSLCSRCLHKRNTSLLRQQQQRQISAYGYTQAKALVYSKYGEPNDVLRYPNCSQYPFFLAQ
jgi:hypothetical protein